MRAMLRAFAIIACLVVILAGVKVSASLIVPFLLAAFLAIVLAPPFIMLKRAGAHGAIALTVMIVGLGVLATLTVTILRTSLNEFIGNLPGYEASLRVRLDAVWMWLENRGIEAPSEFVAEYLDPHYAMSYAGSVARGLSGMLGLSLLIFLIVAFILVEINDFGRKLHALPSISEATVEALEENFRSIRHYVSLKSVMSLLTGGLVGLWLWLLDIDNALFMGLLAFFLNFVPTIGSFIAAIPGVLLGFILLGPTMGIVTAIGYLFINVGISNVLEPRFMGRNLGISPLVILLSLVFWGWLLGPVGMLLSVPLTMAVKFALESDENTRPIAILLGAPPKD